MKGSKRYAKATICCMAVLVSGLVLSCSDDWDAHYDGVPRPTRTLWQEITARPGLSGFAKLLKGYGLSLGFGLTLYGLGTIRQHRHDIGDR